MNILLLVYVRNMEYIAMHPLIKKHASSQTTSIKKSAPKTYTVSPYIYVFIFFIFYFLLLYYMMQLPQPKQYYMPVYPCYQGMFYPIYSYPAFAQCYQP